MRTVTIPIRARRRRWFMLRAGACALRFGAWCISRSGLDVSVGDGKPRKLRVEPEISVSAKLAAR